MDGFREVWVGQATYILFVFVSGIMGCFIGKMLSEITSAIFRWLGFRKNSASKETETLKKATLQIGQDWMEIMKMLEEIRSEQNNFASRLQPEMEIRNQNLYQNVTVSLEQEFLRNDERFKKFKRIIESIHEDISFLKSSAHSFCPDGILKTDEGVLEKVALVDSCAQTEYEMKRKAREGHSRNSMVTGNEGSKLVSMVKECLTEVINDAKLQISIDREDENRELQIIFQRLTEDRKEIKKTIIQAFSLAAEQARKNFDQFGQDAIHYIAVLNANTNKMLKVKFEETDDRLKEILRALNRQILDVVTIQKILENIDGQFDDIFQRVELGCQRNTENCEEIAENLENTSNKWINATSELGSMTKDFGKNIEMFKSMLDDMKGAMDSKTLSNPFSAPTEGDEIVHYDSTADTASQDVMTLSQKNQHLIFMFNVIQTCWEKLTNMNNRIDDGCTEICQQFQTIIQRLQSLNTSAETLENAIKNVNMENFNGRIVCVKCPDLNSRKAINGDSGDCVPDIYQRQGTASIKNTQAEIIQGYSTTMKDKEMKMAELRLKKRNKENYINSYEIALNESIQDSIPLTVAESQAANTKDRF